MVHPTRFTTVKRKMHSDTPTWLTMAPKLGPRALFPTPNINSKPLQTLKGFYSNEVDFPFDHLQMSSEADIFRIRSAHEYYQLVEYELPTPPLLGDTRGQIFSVLIENPPNTIVNGRS